MMHQTQHSQPLSLAMVKENGEVLGTGFHDVP